MELHQENTKDKISRLDCIAIGIAICLTTFVEAEALKFVIGLGSYILIRWYQVTSRQDHG